MTAIIKEIPGIGEILGEESLIILGPNGSGKTTLAQLIARKNEVSVISAQRRTWLDDNLPVLEEQTLIHNTNSQIGHWKNNPWEQTQEINFVFSRLIQNHTNILTQKNEEARLENKKTDPVNNTNLILLQDLWNQLFPNRKLEISGFFPKVKRLDLRDQEQSYSLRQMSDGERTILYMAARVLTADKPIILIDEPELHMHCRLAVQFWDEAEKLRHDCRFIYITHDLNFALSRRNAKILIAQDDQGIHLTEVGQVPACIAYEILGAATLPFYAKRIFFYEGEPGKGFASEFFSKWFIGKETFSIPCGNRDAVCAAVTGLIQLGVSGAEIKGIIDRDFYPDSINDSMNTNILVLPVHEIESVLCAPNVVKSIAEVFGRNPEELWDSFLNKIRQEFKGKTLNNLISQRVRFRIGDLMDGIFTGTQIDDDFDRTRTNHTGTFSGLEMPRKISNIFSEEFDRISYAISNGSMDILALLPGKHLLGLLSTELGQKNSSDLKNLIIRTLCEENPSNKVFRENLEKAITEILPPREFQ